MICIATIQRIAKELNISDFALVGTDYHAGIGNQAAKVYKQSIQIKTEGTPQDNGFGLQGIDINSALHAIGVVKQKRLDEFDTLNLSKHRDFESHFEQYEKYCED